MIRARESRFAFLATAKRRLARRIFELSKNFFHGSRKKVTLASAMLLSGVDSTFAPRVKRRSRDSSTQRSCDLRFSLSLPRGHRGDSQKNLETWA
jgi:hypothetical protein